MDISIEPILYEQKSVFIQMLELYNYDFSEFSNDDINEYGYFGYKHIDDYWNEKGRYPFFIRVNGKLAGLVLVRSCCEYNNLPNPYNIAEFFVMKRFLICFMAVGKYPIGLTTYLPKIFGIKLFQNIQMGNIVHLLQWMQMK